MGKHNESHEERIDATEEDLLFVDDILNARPEVAATREEWLMRAIEEMRTIFAEVGESIPPVAVSVGWPGGGSRNTRIGECWAASAATNHKAQIFISPMIEDAIEVLAVLAHELVHAIDDCQSGHRGRFAKIAKGIGLEGKMTATVAGAALKARLEGVAATLGDYPHGAIRLATARVTKPGEETTTEIRTSGPKKQTTRMLKVECAQGSGYVVRMTRKWIEEVGTPICPCHNAQMVEA